MESMTKWRSSDHIDNKTMSCRTPRAAIRFQHQFA